jgi:hypothetical protein
MWSVVPALHVLTFRGREREGEEEDDEKTENGKFEFGRFEFELGLWHHFAHHSQIRQLGIFLSKSLLSLAVLHCN